MIAVSLMTAQLGAALQPVVTSAPWNSRASASAQASVRILSGARVSLSSETQPEGYTVVPASIRLEDGSRHPAKLVEFQ